MWVVFDPPGYRYTEEPGFHYSITGKDFASKLAPTPNAAGLFAHNFLVHPDLDWIIPRPRQWSPTWYTDSRLDQHVITRDLWAFASGITTREFELTKKSDGTTFPDNKWVQVSRIPDPTTSLDTCNYTTLGTAAGVAMPAGIVTIAVTATTPVGASLTGAPGHCFTPQFEWSAPPPPDDVLVFGFGDLAFILAGDTVTLCRATTPGSKAAWERLGGPWNGVKPYGGYVNAWDQASAPLTMAPYHQLRMRGLKVVQFGFNFIVVYLNGNEGIPVKLNDQKPATAADPIFRAGSWWVGMAPGQKAFWQAQVIGYEAASTTFAVDAGHPLILFDLGSSYQPTIAPERAVRGLIHTAFPSDQVAADTAGLVTATSAYTGNQIAFSVSDGDGDIWDSDGTRHAGGFSLSLLPSTPGELDGAYLAPGVELFELRFPVKFADRDSTPLPLADTEWTRWSCETSYREPRGKRIEIDLKPTGAALFYSGGYQRRGCYPVHIMEDTDADDIADTIRVRGWVTDPEIEVLLVADDAGTDVTRITRVHAEGLLARVDRLPAYLPQLVNPTGDGTISHRYAASEAFQQSGFDPTTDTYIAFSTAFAGTSWDLLPGTWAQTSDVIAKRGASDWAQTWDETHLKYIERLANELLGWVVYETWDAIYYHPDLAFDLESGGLYFPGGTIYRNHANALAAGVPGQCYRVGVGGRIIEPRGNRVRVLAADYEDRLTPWRLDTYPLAITDPSNEHFTGEPITVALMADLTDGEDAAIRSARVFLFQCYRRIFLTDNNIPLAPWVIDGDDDATVGRVWGFEASLPAAILVHAETEQLTSRPGTASHFETRLIGEKVSEFAAAGEAAGGYPGIGILI
jgi:hypothetical protein